MLIKIITDSGSDLSHDVVDTFDVDVVQLQVHFGHELMAEDIDVQTFYLKMRESKDLPKTASPSPQVFLNKFIAVEAGRDILVICMSSNISSTYQGAVLAKEMYEEEGHQNAIEIIDSKTFSGGLSLIVSIAAKRSLTCPSLKELKQMVLNKMNSVNAYFTLNTLENVIKGGRLKRLPGAMASIKHQTALEDWF